MGARTIDYGAFDTDRPRRSGPVLIDRPDKRMMRLRYLVPVGILCIGVIVYVLPIGDIRIVFLPLIWLFAMALVYSLIMHEILARAVYTITPDYVESESGIVGKKIRTMPMRSVRDVTYGQNFIQAVLGISDITVSAPNGDKITLKDVADGNRKRELISKLVLTNSPTLQ